MELLSVPPMTPLSSVTHAFVTYFLAYIAHAAYFAFVDAETPLYSRGVGIECGVVGVTGWQRIDTAC